MVNANNKDLLDYASDDSRRSVKKKRKPRKRQSKEVQKQRHVEA
jgi:hypothetical protein